MILLFLTYTCIKYTYTILYACFDFIVAVMRFLFAAAGALSWESFLVRSAVKMAPKRVLQDWTAFPVYLTVAVWSVMLDESQTQLTKMQTLLQHLTSMGLTNASEPTQATIAAFLSAFDPEGAAVRANAQMGFALFGTVKSKLKNFSERALRAGGLPDPLAVLPAQVNQLPAAMRTHFFPGGFQPVPPQLNLNDVVGWARVWPMRKTNALVREQKATSFTPPADAFQVLGQAAQLMFALQGSRQGPGQSQDLPLHFFDRRHSSGSTLASAPSQTAIIGDQQWPVQQPQQQVQLALPSSSSTLALASSSSRLALPAPAAQPAVPAPAALSALAVPAPGQEEAQPSSGAAVASPPEQQQGSNAATAAVATPRRKTSPHLTDMVGRLAEAQYGKALSPLSPWSHFRAGAESEARRLRAKTGATPLAASPRPPPPPGSTLSSTRKGTPAKRPAAAKPLRQRPAAALPPQQRPAAAVEAGSEKEEELGTPKRARTASAVAPALRRPAAATGAAALRRPAAARAVAVPDPPLRRPAAAQRPAAARELKQTAKCIRSRAYHKARNAALARGLPDHRAKLLAREAWNDAL